MQRLFAGEGKQEMNNQAETELLRALEQRFLPGCIKFLTHMPINCLGSISFDVLRLNRMDESGNCCGYEASL